MIRLSNYINGDFTAPATANYIIRVNPATEIPQVEVPESTAVDINAAVTAAREAFQDLSALTANERAKFCDAIADLIDARLDKLAKAESCDQGKPVWLAKEMDIPRASHNFRFFAGAVRHHTDPSARIDSTLMSYVSRKPVGVAGLISPWNLPLYLPLGKSARPMQPAKQLSANPRN